MNKCMHAHIYTFLVLFIKLKHFKYMNKVKLSKVLGSATQKAMQNLSGAVNLTKFIGWKLQVDKCHQ